MATELLYMNDFDIVSSEARVVAVSNAEDGRIDIILDRTSFYPRGGGQDWDTGTITNDKASVTIEEVRLDAEGIVHHIGTYTTGEYTVGDTVSCRVNTERRAINTRLHSAGHLIDMAMTTVEPDWIAGKGAHYLHMSFVEYQVPAGAIADAPMMRILQMKLDMLLANTYQNRLLFVTKAEMAPYCRHIPDNIPTNKPSRIVLYADDFGIPCGGTHVRQASDIGALVITKIKIKKGLAKVSYAVAGIN